MDSRNFTFSHWYFNSHPHEEDDETNENNHSEIGYFNSHPHEEDDSVRHLNE